MAATLTAVAAHADVSLATASRVFSDPGRVAAATRQRVLETAQRLGYTTTGQPGARTFGLIVPDIANAAFGALARSLQEYAWPGRHRLLLASTAEYADREREHIATFAAAADGLIVCSPRIGGAEIRRLTGAVPLVVINGDADDTAGIPQIRMDARDGLFAAVEHLAALGHRRIAYVPGPRRAWAEAERSAAVREGCRERGLDLVTVGNQAATVNGGLAAAASVVAGGATAVIAYNDLVAVGVIAGARTLGRRCPEDLSVVGVDDVDLAAVMDPGLTSVRVGLERSGPLAVEALLAQLSGRALPTEPLSLGSQLIVRGSTFIAGPEQR
jgi:LacI family transcriptional regulator